MSAQFNPRLTQQEWGTLCAIHEHFLYMERTLAAMQESGDLDLIESIKSDIEDCKTLIMQVLKSPE